MGILDRVMGRRPATTLAADPARDTDRPPTGEVVGEYGGPTTTSYVTKTRDRYGDLLNASKLTPRLINAMREHPTVTACLAAQSLPALRAEWTIACEDDTIREETTRRYAAIHARLMRAMVRAKWAGYSPNVLVWDVDTDGALVITGVRDLDPFTCTPRVDDAGDYEGFRQLPPQGGARIDVPPLQSLWGVENLESGNLYGRSLLIPARQPWQDQQTVGLYHLRYLERFGEPVVVVRAPEGTVDANAVARQNAMVWNAEHPDETPREVPDSLWVSRQQEGLNLGESIRHHSVVSLPTKPVMQPDGKLMPMREWDIEYLSAGTADGAAFLDKLAALDRAIVRGMLVPSLILDGGETVGSNALGQAHRDTFTANIEAGLDDYAAQITQHVLDRLVTFNYGEAAPRCTLEFAPMTDEAAERMWALFTTLVSGQGIALDGPAIAARLGVPVLVAGDDDVDPAAASPFTQVGLPALVAAGIISEDEARELIGLEGPAPERAPLVDAAFAAARAGNGDLARAILGLPARGDAPAHTHDGTFLAAAPGDVEGMAPWKQPAAHDPQPFRRALTAREERVGFKRIEDELNTIEAQTIDELVVLLEASQDRVARQVAGIMRKGGSVADIVAALDTVNVGPIAPWVAAWVNLQRTVWGFGLDSVRRELETFAEAVPGAIGRDGMALVKSYATASAERTLADLSTRVRLEAVSALRSGVSTAGMQATVASIYDDVIRGESQPPRLTTRMLSSKALNEGRADAIARGGIPLQGAQFSAILDKRTCDLCNRQDEQLIGIADLDMAKFTPPLHFNCRCVWVYVAQGEADFAPTWSAPPKSLVDSFGGLVFGS